MEENTEMCKIELDVDGGSIEISVPVEHKESLEKIANDPKFYGRVKNDNLMFIPSKDSDLNEIQTAWKDFGRQPSSMTFYIDLNADKMWKILEDVFKVDISYSTKNSELFISDDELVENSKYFIQLGKGLYMNFIDLGDSTISTVSFLYDNYTYIHSELVENIYNTFSSAVVIYEEEEDHSFYISKFIDNDFRFTPFSLGKEKLKFKAKDKKIFNNISESIKSESNNIHILLGKKNTGKTKYLKNILKTVDRKVVYVPVSEFEYVFRNEDNFFRTIKKFGKTLLVFEDCELYF